MCEYRLAVNWVSIAQTGKGDQEIVIFRGFEMGDKREKSDGEILRYGNDTKKREPSTWRVLFRIARDSVVCLAQFEGCQGHLVVKLRKTQEPLPDDRPSGRHSRLGRLECL